MGIFGPLIFLAILGFIVRLVYTKATGKGHKTAPPFSTSENDFLGQIYFLLGFIFLLITTYNINNEYFITDQFNIFFITFCAIGAIFAYRYTVSYVLIPSVFSGLVWWIYKYLDILSSAMKMPGYRVELNLLPMISVIGLVFVFYAGLSYLHRKGGRNYIFSEFYSFASITFLTIFFFFFSTEFGLEVLDEVASGNEVLTKTPFIFVSYVLAIVFNVVLFLTINFKKLASKLEIGTMYLLTVFFALMVFIPEQKMFIGFGRAQALTTIGMAWTLFFNLLFLGELIWLFYAGYERKNPKLINIGAVLTFVFIMTKYFDWFFSFLDKSLFFIGAGLIFFVLGGFMEMSRRKVVSSLKEKNV